MLTSGDSYSTGTLPGAGSLRCSDCGFAVSLMASDEVPECPRCGSRSFSRASIFSDVGAETDPGLQTTEPLPSLEGLRRRTQQPGDYLGLVDDDRVTLIPLTREWTRLGRSVAADVRLDDPTVSRRHAILVRQPDGVRILDDRSLNGIYVNGEQREWSRISDGDRLMIGRYQLVFISVPQAGQATGPAAADAAALAGV